MLRNYGVCVLHLFYESERALMDGIKKYLVSLLATVFLSAAVKMSFPEKYVGAISSFACAMLLIITALRPVVRLDLQDLSRAISKIRLEEYAVTADVPMPTNEIAADIIKEKTEEYILDKAKQLQFEPETVFVTVDCSGEVPFPVCVDIVGKFTQQQRIDLTLWIEQNLAIGEQNQRWNWR